MTHPNHETALMLLRAAGFEDDEADVALGDREREWIIWRPSVIAMAAAVDAREKALREALTAVMECRRMANIEATANRTAEDLAVCWLNGPAWELARAALDDKP